MKTLLILLWAAYDLFYITSTEVVSSYNAAGQQVYNACLTPDECAAMKAEMDFAQRNWGDSARFYAPYYHQFTMSALCATPDTFQMAFDRAEREVVKAFRHYLRHDNHGRPFFLMGFSQGAMFIPKLLEGMSEAVYRRCLGAYMLGYRLSASDLQRRHVEPATSATEGKVVSFNTVTSVDKQWHLISGDAATCINPVNWTTDGTPAVLVFDGDTLTIRQDTVAQVLLCDADTNKYVFYPFRPGCLHHWDLLFYTHAIRDNIRLRAGR